jgi:peroxiredoxin
MPGRAAALVAAWLLLAAASQRPAIGSAVTWLQAIDLQQGDSRAIKDYAGPKGLVVFFWAGWSERSIDELKRLDAAQQDIRAHGVGIVAVNVDHEAGAGSLDAIRTKVRSLGVAMPVVVDDGLKLFKAYGVVSVPSTALVNDKGELVHFLPGYSHEQRDALFDAIDTLAGVEHAKAEAPVVRGAPAAIRRLQFGRTQLAGGRIPGARSSFEAAAAADPAFADPLVELAALAIDDGDMAKAQELMDKAAGLDKDNALARVEMARLRFVQGRGDEARAALQATPGDALAKGYLEIVQLAGSSAGTPPITQEDAARRMVELRRTTAGSRR